MQAYELGMRPQPATAGMVARTDRRQIDSFATFGLCQSFTASGEIVAEGARADHVYKVISGAVRTVQLLEDGRRQIGSFYLPGEVFGLTAQELHTFSAEAVVDSTVMAIRRDGMAGARAQEAGFNEALFEMTLNELARAQERFTTLGRRMAIERVAWFLLDISDRLASGDTIDLAMCRQDIGDYLGLTIETVSRMMTEVERRNVITLVSSRRVIVENRERLEQLRG